MDKVTSAEDKFDKNIRAVRLLEFLNKLEFDRNPDSIKTDLRKTVYSNLSRLSGNWSFDKENSLGYRLSSSSNSQINNKEAPDSVTMSLTSSVMDDKHLRDIMMSARADAIKDGINLQIDTKNNPELKNYVSVIGLIDNPIALPLSPEEFLQLHEINPSKIQLADENHGKVIRDPENKKKLMFDPEASFTIHEFMNKKEIDTQTVDKDIVKFKFGSDDVKSLGDIFYSINNKSDYFDLVISGTDKQINNLVSIPTYNSEKSSFNPKNSSIEFTGMPKKISPLDLAESLDGIPGENKTIRVLLDEKSPTYAEDCKYLNNVYKELMKINPVRYTLEVYDNYGANSKKQVFSNTHGPGAAYDEELSNRPQLRLKAEEQKQEVKPELS